MSERTRQVGAIDSSGHGCVITQEMPSVGKGTVLVEVYSSLISPGTELSSARAARLNPPVESSVPTPFGYQNAGIVIEVGEGVNDFKPGDRVACMGAGYAQHTDYAVVPKNLCALIPDNVDFKEAAFAHLAMTSLQAIRRGQPELGEYLLVVGLGLVGQMAARLGQIAGMYVMGWDTIQFRTEIAKKWGIEDAVVVGSEDEISRADAFTRNLGFDMSVMAIGGDGTKALQNVQRVMKVSTDGHSMGRICLVGALSTLCQWGAGLGNLDLRCSARTGPGYHDDAWEHGEYEYPKTFMRWTTRSNMEYVLRLMSEGKLDVKALTTHILPLDEIDKAVSAHIEQPDKTLGTILLMEHK